jgi:hypothetical protein
MNVNPRKLKVSGLPNPLCFRRAAAWRPNSSSRGLFPVKLERELLEPRSHRVPEAPRVGFVLEAGNNVVGIA